MKLPKSFTTVTTLSKILAMVLFIALPFIGLLIGMGYQNKIDKIKCANEVYKINQTVTLVTPTISMSNPSPTTPQCIKEGGEICRNPLICPDNNQKCCQGLYAVIESRSFAVCKIPTEDNKDKPRVLEIEQ